MGLPPEPYRHRAIHRRSGMHLTGIPGTVWAPRKLLFLKAVTGHQSPRPESRPVFFFFLTSQQHPGAASSLRLPECCTWSPGYNESWHRDISEEPGNVVWSRLSPYLCASMLCQQLCWSPLTASQKRIAAFSPSARTSLGAPSIRLISPCSPKTNCTIDGINLSTRTTGILEVINSSFILQRELMLC